LVHLRLFFSIQGTLNPKWEEKVDLSVVNAMELKVLVYDKDVLKSDLCGETSIDLTELSDYQLHEIWAELRPQVNFFSYFSFFFFLFLFLSFSFSNSQYNN